MINYKKNSKFISIMVIVAFVCHFHRDIFLHAQGVDELFNRAKSAYNNGKYKESIEKLEIAIGIITEDPEESLNKKEILGGCYLLRGAIYEKDENVSLAKDNYRRAKEEYGVESIEGIDWDSLLIYKRLVKGIIAKEGGRRKKKFPVLLVVGGAAVVGVVVWLLTKKKKPSPRPEFLTSTDSLNVPEGGTAAFEVRLSAQPSSNVSVTVARVSGDTDINVQSGSSLTFTTANWSQNQTVTLAASEDVDTANGSASIRISAPGMQNKDLTGLEQDNDVLHFVTDKDTIYIPEGRTKIFTVMLSNQPTANVQATVTRVS